MGTQMVSDKSKLDKSRSDPGLNRWMDGWRDTEIQRGGESDRSAEYSNNDRSE